MARSSIRAPPPGRISASSVKKELARLSNKAQAKTLVSFFKTGPGQYGEGDVFLGIKVPEQRAVAGRHSNLPLPQLALLLHSPIHEHRLTALLILVGQYQRAPGREKERLVRFYLQNLSRVNNWDLVDATAPPLLGHYLLDKSKERLYRFSKSKSLWERRIAIVSTYAFIRAGQFNDTLRISQSLLDDKQDLIHKATGWMLREVGKKDEKRLEEFLQAHAHRMPRTALRYAIERMSDKKRKYYLAR